MTITQPVQANALFVALPPGVADVVREEFRFYTWNAAAGVQRWMCAWDTTPQDVEDFAAAVRAACAAAPVSAAA